MIRKYMCSACGVELEQLYHECPHCGNPHCVGYVDDVGGYHECGLGMMPDGTECGECSFESCAHCPVWHAHVKQRQQYGKWHCEECGEPLEIWLDDIIESQKPEGDGYLYERRHLMWHCANCGCDYENEWTTQWGDTGETKPQRKYWG